MTTTKTIKQQPLHFGTISMPIAKGLYTNGNYSLIMTLLYIDSRKQKGDDGYEYPFEYNAPDIHFHTNVGLKVINKHLRMLQKRGALALVTDEASKPIRTAKGALKYRIRKQSYEQNWGPNSRGANVLNEGHSAPSISTEIPSHAGHPDPSRDSETGHSQPSFPGKRETSSRVRNEPPATNSMVPNEPSAGHSGTSPNALSPGHSAPTNDNEIFRQGKSLSENENDCSGCASASPPPSAPASAAAAPSQKQGLGQSEEEVSTADKGTHGKSSRSGSSLSGASSSLSSPSPWSRASPSSRSRSEDQDPIDPHYGIPVSYVKRYKAHAEDLNNYIKKYPAVGEDLEAASDEDAGRLIMHLLNVLDLGQFTETI